MALRFALAVNSQGIFRNKHFGDARKFLIYEQKEDKFVLVDTLENPYRVYDEMHGHGSYAKAKLIIDFLKSNNVQVLVAMQFGQNITIINEHFIPIIIYSENVDEVLSVLNKHLHWIDDEWNKKKTNHSLFIIKSGILKKDIK